MSRSFAATMRVTHIEGQDFGALITLVPVDNSPGIDFRPRAFQAHVTEDLALKAGQLVTVTLTP